MKSIFIIIIFYAFCLSAFSQDLSKKEQRKLYKQFEKEQQAEEAARETELVQIMVLQRRFVLEANQLRDKRGNMIHVSSMINFISSDSINGVIQVGSNDFLGANGVGGITVEGPISNYKYTRNEKRGSFNVTYNLHTLSGNYDVMMIISSSGRADATISSSWPGKLNFSGHLIPPILSKVYQGSSR